MRKMRKVSPILLAVRRITERLRVSSCLQRNCRETSERMSWCLTLHNITIANSPEKAVCTVASIRQVSKRSQAFKETHKHTKLLILCERNRNRPSGKCILSWTRNTNEAGSIRRMEGWSQQWRKNGSWQKFEISGKCRLTKLSKIFII